MVYKDQVLETMEDVFNKALELAKSENAGECAEFLECYATYIRNETPTEFPTLELAYQCAKGNLGYFAGYYNNEIYELINKTYGAVHPIFRCNPFEVSPEDAYRKGLEIGSKI